MKDYIPEYFKIRQDPQANIESIVQGNNYRFTIINEHVVRMEYSQEAIFEDRATQTIWYRNFPKPNFRVLDDDKFLKIETNIFHLTYEKNKPFSKYTLKIRLLENNQYWFYESGNLQNHSRNLKGTYRTLDGVDGKTNLEDGVMGRDGFSIIDDSNSLVFNENSWLEKRSHKEVDIYYFGYGHEYKAALAMYYKVSGKTPMIPRYILGNWWSRYWAYTEETLKDVINNFKKLEIPLSICIIDIDWHHIVIPKKYGSGWTGYTWNNNLFPEPKAMINWLHENNLRTALNLHPADGVRAHEEAYKDFAEYMGVNVDNEEPIPFDCADPKFMNGYFKYLHHPHEEMGVDFWWLDWQQGTSSQIEGLDPLWMLNHLHFYDLGRNGKRPFIFSRWPGLGGHRYPIGFSGDTAVTWDSLRFQPYFTATASNVGYGWWSHDIGGHCEGAEEKELYVRWVQYGIFSPIMRLHSTKNPFVKREPWRWDKETIEIVREYMVYRHRLIPYIYTMNYRNYHDDLPLILPLYYEHQDINEAYDYQNEYYFGSEILVSAITNPPIPKLNKTFNRMYLPEGNWYNLFTGKKYIGNRTYNEYYSLDEYAVFAKAGAIIPLANQSKLNDTANPEHLEIHVFPGKSNTFTLYEDDNNTQDYLNGVNCLTKYEYVYNDNEATFIINPSIGDISLIPNIRKYTIKFRNISEDTHLDINKEYTRTYDSKTNTIIIEFETSVYDKIICQLNNIIEISPLNNPVDSIYDLLLKSAYLTKEKTVVWGLVNKDYPLPEKLTSLIALRNTVSPELIDAIISILSL